MNDSRLKKASRLKTTMLGIGLALMVALSGCAQSRTLVVLLPDTDGKVGTIRLQTAKGARQVHTAHQSIQSESRYKLPDAPQRLDHQEVQTIFQEALSAEPNQEFRFNSFTLYCYRDSVNLTPDSKKHAPSVMNALKKIRPIEIYVVGHADRVGTEKHNDDLSKRRAQAAQSLLISKGIDADIIIVSHLGESKPKIDTEDEMEEPLNRRIEIITKTRK